MAFREYAFLQAEAAECGLACLAASAAMLGDHADLASLRRRFSAARGLSMSEMHDIAAAMGLSARSVRCEPEDLIALKTPAILHFGLNHFVVLEQVRGGRVHIFDPARGRRRVAAKEMSDQFTGVATEITLTPAFQRKRAPAPLRLSSLFKWTPQLTGGLAQIFLLSLLLEIYVLASPYYMQIGIDEAALKGDEDLLKSLATGFGLFAVFNVVASALRAVVIQRVTALLSWEMTVGLYHHLIRLPLTWFQSRRLADVLARFQSLDPIKGLIGGGLVAAVVDGVLSIATGIMLFLYAPTLASIVVGSLATYVTLRLVGIPVTRSFASAALVASIAEQGKRIETLRVIQTIKIMGAEAERESDWSNRFAETIRTTQASTFANLGFSTAHDFFGSGANIAIIGFGALAVMKGHMTVGMLYAFTAYQSQFLSRASSLFEQVVSWRMLDLYTFRLADIALTPAAVTNKRNHYSIPQISGSIGVEGVSFRYSGNEKPILDRFSMQIVAGESVAITGPSGCGKSTLLKLVTGLYMPTQGQVTLDGLSLTDWGSHALRGAVGAVLQDDDLLSGSIADNISFFAERVDIDWVWECLSMTGLDDEVRQMPMQVETFVGDMGSLLSGGQKQRVLLARALYRRPKVLVLDEATSHLNIELERKINEALSQLSITRIVVAHRPETIANADRVIAFN